MNMTLLLLLVGSFAFKQIISRHSRRNMTRSNSDPKDRLGESLNLDQRISICPPSAGELRSLAFPNAKGTKTQFHNSARGTANLFWYDFQGNPRFKGTIPSNGFFATKTWEGHAFRVWNKDLTITLLDFRVGRKVVGFGVQKYAGKEETMSLSSEIKVRADIRHL